MRLRTALKIARRRDQELRRHFRFPGYKGSTVKEVSPEE